VRERHDAPLENMDFCRLFLSCCSPLMTHLSHRHTELSGIGEKSLLGRRAGGGGSHGDALLRESQVM
jgi:hypothetical protein